MAALLRLPHSFSFFHKQKTIPLPCPDGPAAILPSDIAARNTLGCPKLSSFLGNQHKGHSDIPKQIHTIPVSINSKTGKDCGYLLQSGKAASGASLRDTAVARAVSSK